MELEQLKFLKENRKYLRGKVTRKCNAVVSSLEQFTVEQCSYALSDIKTLREKLDKSNEGILKGLWIHETEDGALNRELESCDKYDDEMASLVRRVESRITSFSNSPLQPTSETPRPNTQLKLPQLPLPEYSHTHGESLERFFFNFENIISKYSLSNYEKFIFLERQLKNEPLTLIKSLQGSQQSYDDAKSLLTKAFASPTTQKYDVIKRLSNLKLCSNGDPYAFVS
jgi:hypothetical protein